MDKTHAADRGLDAAPSQITISPDGKTAFIADEVVVQGRIRAITLDTNTVTHHAPVLQ